jgi:hypothetical protein
MTTRSSRIRICEKCDCEFDLYSTEKIRAGGRITECHLCAEENTVKYFGASAADGKQSQVTVLQFSSQAEREQYAKFWKNNSGFNKGKSCQLGTHLSTTPGVKFNTIVAHNPTNHKGKLE